MWDVWELESLEKIELDSMNCDGVGWGWVVLSENVRAAKLDLDPNTGMKQSCFLLDIKTFAKYVVQKSQFNFQSMHCNIAILWVL